MASRKKINWAFVGKWGVIASAFYISVILIVIYFPSPLTSSADSKKPEAPPVRPAHHAPQPKSFFAPGERTWQSSYGGHVVECVVPVNGASFYIVMPDQEQMEAGVEPVTNLAPSPDSWKVSCGSRPLNLPPADTAWGMQLRAAMSNHLFALVIETRELFAKKLVNYQHANFQYVVGGSYFFRQTTNPDFAPDNPDFVPVNDLAYVICGVVNDSDKAGNHTGWKRFATVSFPFQHPFRSPEAYINTDDDTTATMLCDTAYLGAVWWSPDALAGELDAKTDLHLLTPTSSEPKDSYANSN